MSGAPFTNAHTTRPAMSDLDGLLAAQGMVHTDGRTAQLVVHVADDWRADDLVEAIESLGVPTEPVVNEGGAFLVRTASVSELLPLAKRWLSDGTKSVPEAWLPDRGALRLWFLTSGFREPGEAGEGRVVFGLDASAPDTHDELAEALIHLGIAPTLIGTHDATPGLRIVGRRRLGRLAEAIGEPPADPRARALWPYPQPGDHPM